MDTTLQQFIRAFGWSLLNSIWHSAIIYGILFILMLSLPKLASKYKHNLAFGSIVIMFLAFLFNFIKQVALNVKHVSQTPNQQNVQIQEYFNNLPKTFSSKAEQYFPIIVAFYLIGIVLQLFVIGKGYKQLSNLKKASLSSIPIEWQLIFEKVAKSLKIEKTINFHLSSIVNVPLVIGYLKPVVLFPIALVNQLESDQVEAILIHELSHIRRNDFLLNLIKTAIETLLFFNPFVWMAGRFIHIEREHACDDLVLKITGKPLNYAHALLKLELLKDKSSPAYALAATGKSQNLYQRIKRITNMKTNYLNAKQQMAALTLGIACLFSIAWINPAEKKKELRSITKQELVVTNPQANKLKTVLCLDTTKKRKIKIVTIDANGKKTEYNSIKEMPDSVRIDFYKDEHFSTGNILRLNIDSNFRFRDSIFQSKIYKEYNSPEAKAKWRKQAEQMAKEFDSPAAKAKWKKYGEDIAKEYSSPEAQAKWKKFGEDIAKEYGSTEAREKWRKMSEDMAAKMSSPEFRAQLDLARTKAFKSLDNAKLSKLARLNSDSLMLLSNQNMNIDWNGSTIHFNDNVNNYKVKQSEEYKKLKQKFDKEVKELKEKIEKAEKKEKSEN